MFFCFRAYAYPEKSSETEKKLHGAAAQKRGFTGVVSGTRFAIAAARSRLNQKHGRSVSWGSWADNACRGIMIPRDAPANFRSANGALCPRVLAAGFATSASEGRSLSSRSPKGPRSACRFSRASSVMMCRAGRQAFSESPSCARTPKRLGSTPSRSSVSSLNAIPIRSRSKAPHHVIQQARHPQVLYQ